MPDARLVALAQRLLAGEELTDDERIEAAAAIERAPAPPMADELWRRNELVNKYHKQYCADHAPSRRAEIIKFLDDIREFENGQFRHLKHKPLVPQALDERRQLLWQILKLYPPVPRTTEGIRLILR